MNDRARELLVKAALDDVPQIRGQLYADNTVGVRGFCAVGVLLHALVGMSDNLCDRGALLHTEYDISEAEYFEIVQANDTKGWDFLTIARKCGQKEPINHG